MSDVTRFQWTSASLSHPGMVRASNEDACAEQPERGLWVVADGMGGHAFGEVASRMIVDSLGRIPDGTTLESFAADVRRCLQTVNQQLRAEALQRHVEIIGSTVVVLLARGRECGYLWAGDSRIYLFREARLTQLTRDHSQAEAFRGLNLLGLVPRNIITRAVGADDSLELDYDGMQAKDGDIFLLCSDGLSNELSEQEISSALAAADCRQACAALVETALKNGGEDNVSVVVVRMDDLESSDKTIVNPIL